MPSDDRVVEVVARAINLDFRRQWSATQAPGPGCDPTSWAASGGILRLDETAEAAIKALRSAGYAVVPVEPDAAARRRGAEQICGMTLLQAEEAAKTDKFEAAERRAAEVYRAMLSASEE